MDVNGFVLGLISQSSLRASCNLTGKEINISLVGNESSKLTCFALDPKRLAQKGHISIWTCCSCPVLNEISDCLKELTVEEIGRRITLLSEVCDIAILVA